MIEQPRTSQKPGRRRSRPRAVHTHSTGNQPPLNRRVRYGVGRLPRLETIRFARERMDGWDSISRPIPSLQTSRLGGWCFETGLLHLISLQDVRPSTPMPAVVRIRYVGVVLVRESCCCALHRAPSRGRGLAPIDQPQQSGAATAAASSSGTHAEQELVGTIIEIDPCPIF